MPEPTKKELLIGLAIFVVVFVGYFVFLKTTEERDPAYRPHLTTFCGRPAFGKVQRQGDNYTFYQAHYQKGLNVWMMGRDIVTLPTGEALHLH